MNEFQLRTSLLDYSAKNFAALTSLHTLWNERLSAGVPLDKELWYDLFGSGIYQDVQDVSICTHRQDELLIDVQCGVWVNEENPFQVLFVYKVHIQSLKASNVEYFTLGNEDELISYCREKGAKL
ncbi:hypothetical protein AAAC51_06950 [Priestia megaterium]